MTKTAIQKPDDGDWYPAALYEQAWENYRNEDDNFRTDKWQYLAGASGLFYAASVAHDLTRIIGVIGLVFSFVTAFYLLRIYMYSSRWLLTKDSVQWCDEMKFLTAAKEKHRLACLPAIGLAVSFPILGGVLFCAMLWYGPVTWPLP